MTSEVGELGGGGGALLLPAQFTASSHSRGAPSNPEAGSGGCGGDSAGVSAHCTASSHSRRAPSNPEAGNGGRGSDSAGVSTLQEVGACVRSPCPVPPGVERRPREGGGRMPPQTGRGQLSLGGRDRGAGAPQMGSGASEPWVMKMCCPGRPWLWAAQTQPGLWTLPLWCPEVEGSCPTRPHHCGHILHGHTEGSASRGACCFSAADLQEEGFPGGSVVKKDGALLSGLQTLIPLPISPRGPGVVIPI